MSGWTVVLRGDWYLPHLRNMLCDYRGNSEQNSCRDEMIAQIEAQIDRDVPTGARTHPLVVIDPDDREQVERLATIVDEWWSHVPYSDMRKDGDLTTTTAMQAALREFANPAPSKPAEPTGLGAVVKDVDGEMWVRTTQAEDDHRNLNKPWASDAMRRNWQIVEAVKVLSEGVQP